MIRWLLTTFVALAVLSACWPWLRKLGIGRMPGDVTVRSFRTRISFPVHVDAVAVDALSFIARLL